MEASVKVLLSSEEDKLKELKYYIDGNLHIDLDIKSLSLLANSSQSSLRRQFKQQFGLALGKYIHAARMQKAYKLLSAHTNTISEIAIMVGYEDRASFSRAFSKYFSYPPTQLQKADESE